MVLNVAVVHMVRRCNQHEGGTLLVSCEAKYPQVSPDMGAINDMYLKRADALCASCRGELREHALSDYRDAPSVPERGFIPYEALMTYAIRLNRQCTMSLYADHYVYTGGAHGLTTRVGDTWNLNTGAPRKLADFFPGASDYRDRIIGEVRRQIARQPDVYFPEGAQLAESAFNEHSFYVSPRGLHIFYQQYDIAPYASGIREFLIPWGTLGATMMGC